MTVERGWPIEVRGLAHEGTGYSGCAWPIVDCELAESGQDLRINVEVEAKSKCRYDPAHVPVE